MSRAAKVTLAASLLVSGLTVWGVHYMQVEERKVGDVEAETEIIVKLTRAYQTMHRGVERDEARQAEKRRLRALELEENKEKERKYQQMQPTKGWLSRMRGGGGGGGGDGSTEHTQSTSAVR
jgi:protein PET117